MLLAAPPHHLRCTEHGTLTRCLSGPIKASIHKLHALKWQALSVGRRSQHRHQWAYTDSRSFDGSLHRNSAEAAERAYSRALYSAEPSRPSRAASRQLTLHAIQRAGQSAAPRKGKSLKRPPELLDGRELTKAIQDVPNWLELQQLYSKHRNVVNAIHISATLIKLAQLQASASGDAAAVSSRAIQDFRDSVLQDVLRLRGTFTPREIANVLTALARMGYDQTLVVKELAGIAADLLEAFSETQHFAATAWALAKLGYNPGPAWIKQFLWLSRYHVQAFNNVELANMLWSMAKWDYCPSAAWMALYHKRFRAKAADMSSQELTNVAWALAVLKLKPPRDVIDPLLLESQVKFPTFTDQGLANMAWAVCSLGIQPPAVWIEDFLGYTLIAMQQYSQAIAFSNTVWALSNWQATPTEEWTDYFCVAATKFIPRMDAASLGILLVGLADIGAEPDQTWINLTLEELHKRHNDADGKTLVSAVWAISRLMRPHPALKLQEWWPGGKWLMRYRPILQDLADAISRSFKSLDAADLVDAAVAFADLHYYPGDEWMERLEAYANLNVHNFTAYQARLLTSAVDTLDDIFPDVYIPKKGEKY